MQFRKPKNWNEPFKHDSFALLAPKNRNNRNQEFEKKSAKEKPRILFSKIFDCGARAATGPDNPKDTGPYTPFPNPFNEPHLAHGRRPRPLLVNARFPFGSSSFPARSIRLFPA